MTQCTEAWLVADREALRAFFGKGLTERPLPAVSRAEHQPPAELMKALKEAAKGTAKGTYRKAFAAEVLRMIRPDTVAQHCTWAKRFFDSLTAAAQ